MPGPWTLTTAEVRALVPAAPVHRELTPTEEMPPMTAPTTTSTRPAAPAPLPELSRTLPDAAVLRAGYLVARYGWVKADLIATLALTRALRTGPDVDRARVHFWRDVVHRLVTDAARRTQAPRALES
jgi:hypothetical protein